MRYKIPDIAEKAARSNLTELYSPFKGVSFVVNSLTQSQMAYSLLHSINTSIGENPYYEVSIYNLQKELPIIIPHCAIYNGIELNNHIGPIITTDIQSWLATKTIMGNKPFFYIYDITLFKFIPVNDIDILRKSNTIFFTRSNDHRKFLKKNFKLDTINEYVEDFEIDKIKTIIEKYYENI